MTSPDGVTAGEQPHEGTAGSERLLLVNRKRVRAMSGTAVSGMPKEVELSTLENKMLLHCLHAAVR